MMRQPVRHQAFAGDTFIASSFNKREKQINTSA
jgi:hypothetical protein